MVAGTDPAGGHQQLCRAPECYASPIASGRYVTYPTEELLSLAQPSSRRFTSEARPISPFAVGPLFLPPPAPARSLSHPLQARVQIWTATKIGRQRVRYTKPAATVRPGGLFLDSQPALLFGIAPKRQSIFFWRFAVDVSFAPDFAVSLCLRVSSTNFMLIAPKGFDQISHGSALPKFRFVRHAPTPIVAAGI
jgi:hypothetical protein